MNANVLLMVASLFYLSLVAIMYFSKRKVNNFETKIYKYILVIAIIGVILDLIGVYVSIYVPDTHIIRWIVLKAYYTYLLSITYLLSVYLFIPGKAVKLNRKQKNKLLIYTMVFIVCETIHLLLPIHYYKNGNIIYAYGPDNNFLYGAVGVTMIIWFIYIMKDINKIKQKKNLPIASAVVLMTPIVLIQMLNPALLLVSGLISFIIVMMYFTIENPDVKMLEEFKIAKNRAERANEEKELFLYNVTQDVRVPLYDIKKASNWLSENVKEIKDKDIKDGMYYINSKASNILEKVNNILDVTNMEITNIKVYNAKYDIRLLLEELNKNYISKVTKGVKLKFNIDSNIPSYLDGDMLRLKQLLSVMLDNACKYTSKGYIEVNLNTVVKRDVCRLIISVEDTGCGIKATDIDEIFNKDNQMYASLDKIDDNKKNLAIAKSIATLLGGILMLESEIGSGTKVTLVLDQKIYDEKSESLEKLEGDSKKYIDVPKVMVVSEDDEYLDSLVKKLSKYEIEIEALDLGEKCLNKVRLRHKYDLIIMDEELKKLNALEILNKLKEINGFDIDVAILTNNPDNKGYIKDGFKYILNRKITKKEIDELINGID